MSLRIQIIIVIAVLLSALTITRIFTSSMIGDTNAQNDSALTTEDSGAISPTNQKVEAKKIPVRKMEVLDPQVDAESVLVQSLNLNFPLFNYQTSKKWPIASITKLMTAIVISEQFGLTKKIPITKTAVEVEGIAGDLKSGEVYSSEDLMKIMLLVSSNRAATAFEEFVGGRELFANLLNTKAKNLGMTQTVFYDGSGLSTQNESTTSDLLKLAKYLIEKHPEIISWTRLQTIKVQPMNTAVSRNVYNINTFASETTFLGGKTGTSYEARENLLALFSFDDDRVVYIILGTHVRVGQ
ncbi:MAG: serine hydrolase, partial [Patescibacteria group bacterium]